MLFGLEDKLLHVFGIYQGGSLAQIVACLLIIQSLLLALLVSYVIYRRLYRLWNRRNNRERATAYRDTILAYLEAQKNDSLPSLYLLNKAIRSKIEYGFLRRVLLAQIDVAQERDQKILQNLYQDLGFYKDDVRKTRSFFWWRKLAAVIRLEKSRIPEASNILINLFSDKNELVAISAIRAMAHMNHPDKESLILTTLARVAPSREDLFLDMLTRFGQKNPNVVLQFLENCFDPHLAIICLDVMARLKVYEAGNRIVYLLKSGDERVIARTLRTLRVLDRVRVIKDLRSLTKEPSALIRAEAALCYLTIDPQLAQKILRDLQKDPSLEVRRVLFDAKMEASA